MYYMSGFPLEKPLGAEKSYERKDKETHRKNKGKEAADAAIELLIGNKY